MAFMAASAPPPPGYGGYGYPPPPQQPLSSQADSSLAASMTDLIHNILNTLDATPPPGQTFSPQDISNIRQVGGRPSW